MLYSGHRKLYTNIDTLMPTDNDASNHAIKVESVSIDTKRIQTEGPHTVGTSWNARVEQTNLYRKRSIKKPPNKGLKGLPAFHRS